MKVNIIYERLFFGFVGRASVLTLVRIYINFNVGARVGEQFRDVPSASEENSQRVGLRVRGLEGDFKKLQIYE